MRIVKDPALRINPPETIADRFGAFTLLGADWPGGAYVLRIRVPRPLKLIFGGFKRGKVVEVPAGDHAYTGSAQGLSGPLCLARRLVRHATRTGNKRPHRIRRLMLSEFPRLRLAGGELRPRNGKHHKWNVDYLLDVAPVELVAAYAIRWPDPQDSEHCHYSRQKPADTLEAAIGRMIEQDESVVVYERGLGANDQPDRSTFLVHVNADEEWWDHLRARLLSIVRERKRIVNRRAAQRRVSGQTGCATF